MNIRRVITVSRQRLAYRAMLYAALSAGILQWTFINELPAGSGAYYVDAVIAIAAIMLVFPLPGGFETIFTAGKSLPFSSAGEA